MNAPTGHSLFTQSHHLHLIMAALMNVVIRMNAEMQRLAPRPVEMLEFMRSLEEHLNPGNMEWQDLEEMDAVTTVGDAIIHLRGWRFEMTDDPNERDRLLDVYRGDGRTDGLLKLVLMRYPRLARNRYLADYGDLIRNANWNDPEVSSFESDVSSYHGDSVQEEHHALEQFVNNAERANRSLIALTQYANLVQFMEGLEGGPATLAHFARHIQREADEGRYPFIILPRGSQEEFLEP